MPTRCAWANGGPLEIEYHDTEWGVPSRDDRHLFEMLTRYLDEHVMAPRGTAVP